MDHLRTHHIDEPRVNIKESRINGRIELTVRGPDEDYSDRSDFICTDEDKLICECQRQGPEWEDHLWALFKTGWWTNEEINCPKEELHDLPDMVSKNAMLLHLPRRRLLGDESQQLMDYAYDGMREWLTEDASDDMEYPARTGCDCVDIERHEEFGIVTDWVIRERGDRVFLTDLPIRSSPLTPVRLEFSREGDQLRYHGSPTPNVGHVPYNILSALDIVNAEMEREQESWVVLDAITAMGTRLWMVDELGILEQDWGDAVMGIAVAQDLERGELMLNSDDRKKIPDFLGQESLSGAAAIFPVVSDVLGVEGDSIPDDPRWDAWNRLHVWDKDITLDDIQEAKIGVSAHNDVHEIHITKEQDEIFGSSLTRQEVVSHIKARTPIGLSIVDRDMKV